MKYKDLEIHFRHLIGNIACLTVDSISGESIHNDINNEEAIIIFNSLVGEKENCQTVKTLLEENAELKKQLEEIKDNYNCLLKQKEQFEYIMSKQVDCQGQQQEFIKYLEDEIKACEAVSDLLFNSNKEIKVYKEILQKYEEIIGVQND